MGEHGTQRYEPKTLKFTATRTRSRLLTFDAYRPRPSAKIKAGGRQGITTVGLEDCSDKQFKVGYACDDRVRLPVIAISRGKT